MLVRDTERARERNLVRIGLVVIIVHAESHDVCIGKTIEHILHDGELGFAERTPVRIEVKDDELAACRSFFVVCLCEVKQRRTLSGQQGSSIRFHHTGIPFHCGGGLFYRYAFNLAFARCFPLHHDIVVFHHPLLFHHRLLFFHHRPVLCHLPAIFLREYVPCAACHAYNHNRNNDHDRCYSSCIHI